MTGYLGEFPVDLASTPFARWTAPDWAIYFISKYGGIDGAHHKQWLIDQLARILNGATVTVVEARWEGGLTEYRIAVSTDPCPEYARWVAMMKEDGNDWDEGITP